jgi:DNA mismatch repair ATPase MutS
MGHVVTAHQANYLPYLGFFQKIHLADHYVLVDDTQFVKRGSFGWIHRNKILSQNGPQWLTIPVKTQGRYDQRIMDTIIDNNKNWKRKHLRALEINYTRSPHFKDLFTELQDIYNNNWTKLVDLNENIILWVMKKLDIQRPTTRSSNLDCKGRGSDYVLELAQKSGADTYLSGIHGKDYLNIESFESKKIKLSFQNFQHPIYKQQHNQPFVSNLCTLDALFNIGKEATKKLITKQ